MTRHLALLILFPLVSCHSRAQDSASPAAVGSVVTQAAPRGSFGLIDSSGRRIGQVSAAEVSSGVQLEISVTSLSPGRHGMHLHAAGICEPPAFATATGHLNPAQKQHGTKNPLGAHLGDLPNLVVDPQGVGRARVVILGASLHAGSTSITVPGTALVIHAAPDDELTDPAGNSGARIGCAAIRLAPPAP